VAAQLISLCSGPIDVDAIPVGTHYLGPTFADATPCRCSTVTYSLLSACAGCQNRDFTSWVNWSLNCPYIDISTFSRPIPSVVSVPTWAYLNVTVSNFFDPLVAQANATSNAATSTTTTTTAQPSATPSNPVDQEPSTNPAPSTSSRSNAGAIAGGVVGGVVFLVAVVGILWILLRRRRESKKRAFDRRAVNLDEDEAPSSFPPTEGYTNDRVVPPISVARMPYPHALGTEANSEVSSTAMYTTFGTDHSARYG